QMNISEVAPALSANTPYIINNVYRNNRIDQYVNYTTKGNNTSHNGTLRSWTDVAIGSQANEGWNGNIAEVIFYNFAISDAQRIIVNNYLAAKYGLLLGNMDLYTMDDEVNGNFDHE